MGKSKWHRKIVKVESRKEEFEYNFGGLKKKSAVRNIFAYTLECGHIVYRNKGRDHGSVQRETIHCEWCESGEEQIV